MTNESYVLIHTTLQDAEDEYTAQILYLDHQLAQPIKHRVTEQDSDTIADDITQLRLLLVKIKKAKNEFENETEIE